MGEPGGIHSCLNGEFGGFLQTFDIEALFLGASWSCV